MSLKSGASKKRAEPVRDSEKTRQFIKDWEALAASGRYNLNHLKEAMLLLISADEPLGAEWLDHALTGDWKDHRECHIGGDFLLIYRIESGSKTDTVVFVRAGTHSQLFK